jgi:hypothetical protein
MIKSPSAHLAIQAFNYDKAAHEGLKNNSLFQEFKQNYIKNQSSYKEHIKASEQELVEELSDFKELLADNPAMVAKLAAARDFIKTNPGQQFDKSFLRGIQLFEMIEGEIK